MATTKERKFVHVWDVFGDNAPDPGMKDDFLKESSPHTSKSNFEIRENSEVFFGEGPAGIYRQLNDETAPDIPSVTGGCLARQFDKQMTLVSSKGGNANDNVTSLDSSGVETDDNSTPGGSVDGRILKFESMRADSDSEGFEEDECTIEFEAEDEGRPESRVTRVYDEYQGEDFSQYLNDDESNNLSKESHKHRRAKLKKSPSVSSDSSGTGRGAGMKMRLGTMFGRSGSSLSCRSEDDAMASSIHSYTFADCKMGNCKDDKLGRQAESGKWWSRSMLSAQTLSSHSDILLKARKCVDDDAVSSLSEPAVGTSHAHQLSDTDFESYRKSRMYDTKSKGKRARPFLFKHFGRKPEDTEDLFGQNATENPLTHMDKTDSEHFVYEF